MRDKIRPADTKAPNLGCFARAGRVLSRLKDAQQPSSNGPTDAEANGRQEGLGLTNFACNSPMHTSCFEMQSLKLQAFHGFIDCRRQGIACEIDTDHVAGPGRASRRHAEPHVSDQAPLAWRAPEGPEGTGKSRTATSPARLEAAAGPAGPGRASRRRAERSSRRGRRAGGQATRRPEIWRRHKQHPKSQNSS